MSVLVVSWDRVGGLMAGSAVRALEMARALAGKGLDVVLAAPAGSECDAQPGLCLVRTPGEAALPLLMAQASSIVLPGRVELMAAVKKPLVVDLYDPFVLSNLDFYGNAFARSHGRPLLALRWLQHHLANGDFFLCASRTQRSFWLGMLAAAGRLNRSTYEGDPELRRLLDLVPFGLPDAPPTPGAPVVRGVIPGIEAEDRVVLWAGGLWNWVDPLTLVRAQALLRERRPGVKTLILGTRHPNPEIGEMAIAQQAIALAEELGLRDRGVSFVDWVPYEDRQRYLLECDVGVSLHRAGVESEFAFRTRILDYLWGLLPMVVSEGDDLAVRVGREGLGRVVRAGDPEAVAAAIEGVLDEPDTGARRERLAAARASFSWSTAIEPLWRFCADPHHAADHAGGAWVAWGTPRSEAPSKDDALVADDYLTDARALSPAVGRDYAPRQRFRAVYDGLCRIDVLLWTDPPVAGANLVFELYDVGGGSGDEAAGQAAPGRAEAAAASEPAEEGLGGDQPLRLARVLIPVSALPRSDWQTFEFRPVGTSRGRWFEIRLSVVPTAGSSPSGRVSVWLCAPPPGEPALDDGLGFIARYLVGGVAASVPMAEESFLFLHGATVPLARETDDGTPLLGGGAGDGTPVVADDVHVQATRDATLLEPIGSVEVGRRPEREAEGEPESMPASVRGVVGGSTGGADVDRLRADLARTAMQAARAEERVAELLAEMDARVAEAARSTARDVLRETQISLWLLERAARGASALVRRVGRAVVVALVLGLCVASVPLALVVAFSILVVDGLARLRGRVRDDAEVPRRVAVGSPGGAASSPSGATADAPVSIVIPSWNGRDLLEMSLPPLLEAVRRHGHPDDEIIVVDNGSDDASPEVVTRMAAEAACLRLIRLSTNEGFAGATNRGAREAKNPILVLLNNDMVVEADFIAPLLEPFDQEPDLFGVSCQIDFIDPSKARWETGKVHARLERGSVRLFHLDRFDEDLLYPIFFAGGGASAYDRAKFLALGGFDEAVFSPVYIEDVDLGYRAWKRGWPAVLAPRSKVHHKHRGTTRRLWSEGRIHSFFVKNLAALAWKNFDSRRILLRNLAGLTLVPLRVLRDQGGRSAIATFVGLWRQIPTTMRARLREERIRRALSDEEIFHLSRYRHAYRAQFHPEDRAGGGRPQVLVVSPYSPAPAVHGGATRIANLLAEVRGACDVTLVSYYDTEAERRPESLARLRALCRDVALVPRDVHERGGWLLPNATVGFWSQRMFDEVEAWLDRRRFDVVQVEYTHMAHYLPAPVAGLRRVLVEHDIHFVAVGRARSQGKTLAKRLALRLDELRALRYEIAAVEGADLVLTMSDTDRDALARFVDPAPIAVVPNGVSCREFREREAPAAAATILFVGFFRHDPNVEAVLWFAREVLPLVRHRVPDVRFQVVGAYPPSALADLARAVSGVEITGMVPETASYYRSATVFVAPILRGSGTRLKILEAMASGCPVVSTSIGAEGLGAGPNEIRLADEPRIFAEEVLALIERPESAREMATAARRFVEARYDWPAIARRLVELYGFATNGAGGGSA